ncbi:MAG: MFS transporter [Bacteroidota bacterium]|nr:MFS transporter [Bacteroidota bacterium]
MEQTENKSISLWKSFPVFLAFLCMGFGDAVGPFVGLAKGEFHLSNTMAQLIAFMGFIMFGILSVPIGILQDKIGKKFILIIGLSVALVGMIIPMIALNSFGLFLLTVLFLGAGSAINQVAGNPIMRDVSAPGKYSRNLSLGQFIKAIGSLSGPVLPALAVTYWNSDWKLLFPVYSVFLFLTILCISITSIKEHKIEGAKPANFKSCFALLKNPFVLTMVLGIFVYVGAEVCMSSGLPIYFNNKFNVDIQKIGLLSTGLFFIALMAGRFLGSVILNWLSPKRFFLITCFLAILGILGLFLGVKSIAYVSAFLTGLGFANIFPLIFSITVDAMPERSNELSGLMVTAIVGGAIIPVIMGFVADKTNATMGFLVPLLCLIFITITAFRSLKKA